MSLSAGAGTAFRLMDVRKVCAGAYQTHIHQAESPLAPGVAGRCPDGVSAETRPGLRCMISDMDTDLSV